MEELHKHLASFFPPPTDGCKSTTVDGKKEEEKPIPEYATTIFTLPIEYLPVEEKHALSSTVSADLELVLGENPMYSTLLRPSHLFSQQLIPQYQKHFTTNVDFLQDTQQVVSNMKSFETDPTNTNTKPSSYCIPCEVIQKQWKDVKHTPGFKETYGYLDWSFLESLNYSSLTLQGITLANMLSPLMSFFIPFLFLLFPFLILKIQGVPITMRIYLDVLKNIAKHHFIGKAIATFESFSIQNLIYLMAMLALYGLQMYQNTMQCLRFYRNIQKINDDLLQWKLYVNHSIEQMTRFAEVNRDIGTYKGFNQTIVKHVAELHSLQELLDPIYPFQCSIWKTTDIGYMMKVYYLLHNDEAFEQALVYSMGFHGYVDHLSQLYSRLCDGSINKAIYCTENDDVVDADVECDDVENVDDDEIRTIYSESTTGGQSAGSGSKADNTDAEPKCKIEDQYYPLQEADGVRNDVILDHFGIITGPNASGKTTYLKTTAINIILSQQFGMGFYSKCTLNPYTHIHSYLNIPDTSGRDSLFQAESRRCKEILQTIQQKGTSRQFCIFDELYSGTNPKEATKSAYAFMEFLRQYKHVDLFLTTHYVSICDQWTKPSLDRKIIENYQMVVKTMSTVDGSIISDDEWREMEEESEKDPKKKMPKVKRIPTYGIAKGISHIEGALGILEDMEYPEEMIEMIRDN